MTMHVPGMPNFVVGEETVILLERHATGYTLTGAPQGKFHVFRDKKGIKHVRRDLDSAHMVEKDKHSGRIVAAHAHKKLATPATGYQPLKALRTEIVGYVQAQRKAARRAQRAVEKPRKVGVKR